MKEKKKTILIVVIAIFILGGIGISYYKSLIRKPFKLSVEKVNLEVKDGQSINDVLRKLSSQDIIGNTYFIKYYIKSNDINTTIKPGKYIIEKDMDLNTFLDNLVSGKTAEGLKRVTIPEGFTVEEIGAKLEENSIISKAEFLKAVKEYELPVYIRRNNLRKYPLEGFLFPDTYDFEKGTPAVDIIERMLNRFEDVISEIEKSNGQKIDKNTIDDIVTIASIVEKEAEKDTERPKVASVFYNRIDKKMKFQSCATVLYSLGYHKAEISNEDLKVESPYNTYKVDGLPVGPIASPGKSSLQAAISPDKTNYLFFISNDDGTHSFTSSEAEFTRLKNIRDNKNKK